MSGQRVMRAVGVLAVVVLAGAAVACGRSPRRAYYPTAGSGGGTTATPTGPVQAGDARGLLNQADGALRAAGFSLVGQAVHGQLTPGSLVGYGLEVTPGQCYAVLAIGNPPADIDLTVVDPGGQQLGFDVHPDPRPWVVVCPRTAGRMLARVQTTRAAAADFFYAAYSGPRGATVSLASVLGTPGGSGASSGGGTTVATGGGGGGTVATGTGLVENFRLLDNDMRARGYEPYGEPTRGNLTQGQTREIPIELETGRCYAILAVGDTSVRDLDVLLLDSGGRQIDRDRAPDARPTVRVCATSTGSFNMQVRMFAGSGAFAYQAYRWPRGTSGPFGLRGLIYVRLAEVTALLQVDGYGPDDTIDPGRGTLRRQGDTADESVTLQSGECYAVVAVGGDGVADLDLALSYEGQEVATDQSVSAFPSVRHCATGTGPHRIRLRAADGAGPYFYQVFRRGAE